MKRSPLTVIFATRLSLSIPTIAIAKPKPVAGGANQIAGVQARYPNAVFNGFVRIKPKDFGPALPQDWIT